MMQLTTGNRTRDISGLQLSLLFAVIVAVMGILLGVALELMKRVRLNPKVTQTLSRTITWLGERTVLGLWRPEA
jgi:ABC-type amino acid transport system permease subunit